MAAYRSIPKGYMTIGEAAKKMGVTVRTLQYYDKEGLLPPSAESEGGRRLYTDKDLIKLHQILSLKSLGFSLNDIRERLISLETPEAVAKVLTEQAQEIRRKIGQLSECLNEVEQLKKEVLLMQSVDLKKYADIIVNLQMKNEFYYLIKHFDDETLDHIRLRFDKESGLAFMEKFNRLTGDPEIIFLDEPTAGLDVEARQQLHSQIHKLKAQGKTIMLASHDMAEVEALCDRIAVLDHGSLVFCGTTAQLTEQTGKKYSIFIRTSQGNETFETDNIKEALDSLLQKFTEKGIEILDMKVDRGTLEQHFIEMTRRKEK